MYVGGRGNSGRRTSVGGKSDERFTIPNEYSGNALRDPEALLKAEEAFRRGYVFEENTVTESENDDNTTEKISELKDPESESLLQTDAEDEIHIKETEKTAEVSDQPKEEAVAASSVKFGNEISDRGGGFLSGIFGNITTEQIIIVALILILWESRADDELLIMLAILLFC